MSSSTRRSVLTVALVAGSLLMSLAGGCSSSDDESGSSGSSGGSSGFQSTACSQDARKDIYTAGLSKKNDALQVMIVESTPSPPKKGTNTMLLQIVDAAGKPVEGATVSVTPYMPDHAHGSAVVPAVTSMGEGKYAVAKLYYPMPGLWKVTVTVQMAGGAAPQEVAFNFCFDG